MEVVSVVCATWNNKQINTNKKLVLRRNYKAIKWIHCKKKKKKKKERESPKTYKHKTAPESFFPFESINVPELKTFRISRYFKSIKKKKKKKKTHEQMIHGFSARMHP